MADVAEVVNKPETVEKEVVEKEVVDVEDGKAAADKKEKDSKPKENGKAETNKKNEPETNGVTEKESSDVTAGVKRKSGAGDAPDGTPAENVTPEKKAKISNEDKEKDCTNGESEVASESVGNVKNMSYQKHF